MFIEIPRPLYWEGSSKKDFQTFPLAVQKHLGMSLFIVQVQARYGPHQRQP